MADLKQVPIPSEADRRADLVRELTNYVAAIQRGEIPCDCFLLVTMDTRQHPPLIYPLEYNLNFGDTALMTDYAKYFNLGGLHEEFD